MDPGPGSAGFLLLLLWFMTAVGALVRKAVRQGDQVREPPRVQERPRREPKPGKRHRKCLDQLLKVAGAAGLTELREMENGLFGRCGDFKVHLKRRDPDRVSGTRIEISGLGHRWPGIHLQRSRSGARLDKGFETGDSAFDAKVHLHGKMPLARALLDAGTRKAAGELIGGRLRLDGGWELEVEARVSLDTIAIEVGRSLIGPETETGLRGSFFVTDQRLPEVIGAAVAFARGLVVPPSLPVRIAENLRSEADGKVGLRCLGTLLEWFPKDPATSEALRAATQAGSVEVRLRAALALGKEGREALIALALEKDAGEPFRARAIGALGGHLPRETAEQVYASALANGETRAAAACLAALGKLGGEEAVAVLGRAIGESIRGVPRPGSTQSQRLREIRSGGELGAAAARALGETRLPSAEAPLLANLERGRAVTLACAEALGRVGSARAVPSLKDCAARRPGDRQLRRAVRQAVAEIQSRLEGVEPGRLSLAAGGAGELSVAGDASGRLTVSGGDPTGRLSVSPGDPSGRLSVSEDQPGPL